MELKEAVRTAAENMNSWLNGAVVVDDGDGGYSAIPSAYLTDGSYTGSREVVVDLANITLGEITGDGDEWEELDESSREWVIGALIEAME